MQEMMTLMEQQNDQMRAGFHDLSELMFSTFDKAVDNFFLGLSFGT